MYYVLENEAVSTGYIHQVNKLPKQKQIDHLKPKLWAAVPCLTKSTPPNTWLYILKTFGQGIWNFDANSFWHRRTVDGVVISSTLLNRIVTNQL